MFAYLPTTQIQSSAKHNVAKPLLQTLFKKSSAYLIAMLFNTPGIYRASIDTQGKLTVSIFKD